MNLRHVLLITGALGTGFLMTACSSSVLYVGANDPVIGICQQPAVLNVSTAQNAIDNANNNDPSGINTYGQQMSPAQISQILDDAKTFTADAALLSGSHPGLANDFRTEAALFQGAANQGNGLTTNTVAVSVDKYTGLITDTCNSFRVGTAPPQTKPGPGVWDWNLFWLISNLYVLMIPVASLLIAFSEREKPRAKRLGAGEIFWFSVIWWGALIILAARIYRQILERVKITPDERKNDQLTALGESIRALEAENKDLKKKQKLCPKTKAAVMP